MATRKEYVESMIAMLATLVTADEDHLAEAEAETGETFRKLDMAVADLAEIVDGGMDTGGASVAIHGHGGMN